MRFNFSNRKGLSTIVGGLLFTILMIAGFSVMSLALDAQTDIVNTQRMMSDVELKKQQENFAVAAYTDASEDLQISINNKGQNPLEISSVWIINKTLSDQPATRYSISPDDAVVSPGFTSEIIGSQNLNITPDTYDVKVVSTLGTIEMTELANGGTAPSSGALRSEMITDPPDVIIGQNVTVALIVTNSGPNLIEDVIPDPITVTGTGNVVTSSLHSPNTVDLNKGESVMFTWDYNVNGTSGDDLVFSTMARGDDIVDGLVVSNTASDVSILREPTDGGSGEGEIILKDELFGKPKIFMIFPNALGDEDSNAHDRPIWGVNVANPTDQPIFVSKVAILTIAPRATASDAIFVSNCEGEQVTSPEKPVTIFPTTDKWSCPESNQLMWKDIVNPQRIEPRSVFPFLVQIGAGNSGSSLDDAQNILVQPIVFSTLGQFGKSGYGSTMHNNDIALPNVFLARNPQSVASSDIMAEIRGIVEGDTVTFNATIADMSDDINYGINSGTDLIINVPQDWTFNDIVSYSGFDTPTVTTFPDGSTQIIGSLNAGINTQTDSKTITFTATAPSVQKAKMYVMHILASGTATGKLSGGATGTFTVGPISESVLQVCPTSGCP